MTNLLDKAGIENLTLQLEIGIRGDCTLCDKPTDETEQVYLFTEGETLLMVFHDKCFNLLAVTISQYVTLNSEMILRKETHAN